MTVVELAHFVEHMEKVYVTHNEHEAHHHYLTVITTEFDPERAKSEKHVMSALFNREPNRAYQILQSSQLLLYKTDIVPGEF